MYLMVISSLLGVCILQFVNDMILCSLALSFAIASFILLTFHVSCITCSNRFNISKFTRKVGTFG